MLGEELPMTCIYKGHVWASGTRICLRCGFESIDFDKVGTVNPPDLQNARKTRRQVIEKTMVAR